MASLNRVQLIGRPGRDPEMRYTPKGTPSTRFSLAVNRNWTNAEGQRQEETDWFHIEAWGKLGEICQQYLKKGRLIYIGCFLFLFFLRGFFYNIYCPVNKKDTVQMVDLMLEHAG